MTTSSLSSLGNTPSSEHSRLRELTPFWACIRAVLRPRFLGFGVQLFVTSTITSCRWRSTAPALISNMGGLLLTLRPYCSNRMVWDLPCSCWVFCGYAFAVQRTHHHQMMTMMKTVNHQKHPAVIQSRHPNHWQVWHHQSPMCPSQLTAQMMSRTERRKRRRRTRRSEDCSRMCVLLQSVLGRFVLLFALNNVKKIVRHGWALNCICCGNSLTSCWSDRTTNAATATFSFCLIGIFISGDHSRLGHVLWWSLVLGFPVWISFLSCNQECQSTEGISQWYQCVYKNRTGWKF